MSLHDPSAHKPRTDAKGRADMVTQLHELYAIYPGERHEVLAQALLQARKNLPSHESFEGIQREVGRLLGLQAILNLKARENGEEDIQSPMILRASTDAALRL